MKRDLKILFSVFLLIFLVLSCKRRSEIISEKITNKTHPVLKFQSGILVCVGNNEFIVIHYSEYIEKYELKLIDCRSDACTYWINESEIKKCQ